MRLQSTMPSLLGNKGLIFLPHDCSLLQPPVNADIGRSKGRYIFDRVEDFMNHNKIWLRVW